MEWISDPSIWIAFGTLAALEIVLGIDNIIFISILAAKLPAEQQNKARLLGLGLAMIMRVLLLLTIAWIIRLTAPLFTVLSQEISGRDMILILGGLFLVGKSTFEIHEKLEGEHDHKGRRVAASFAAVLIQIMLLDVVFSLDSVITAVGLVQNIPVMIAAIIIAVLVMMAASGTISDFIEKHPSLKMLALSFLIVVGTVLIAEAFDVHVPKGYVYFAMAFSLAVETLNIRMRVRRERRTQPVQLHKNLP